MADVDVAVAQWLPRGWSCWLSGGHASNAPATVTRAGLVVLKELVGAGPAARLLSWRGLRAWERFFVSTCTCAHFVAKASVSQCSPYPFGLVAGSIELVIEQR